jgi:hypothetical protein
MARAYGPGVLPRAFAAIAFAAVFLGCAAPTAPHWSGDGIHVVDGYWMLREQPCDLGSADLCDVVAQTAETRLGVDSKAVVRVATAELPRWESVGADGQSRVVIRSTSGLAMFVILDLADGSRHVTGVGCLAVPNPDGSTTCLPDDLTDYRVGHWPTY